MIKKIVESILKILIVILVYLLQIYVVNSTTLFGVKGDLCLMVVVLFALMENNAIAYVISGICGMLSDVLFLTIPCKYIVIYIIVTSVLIGLKKMYKEDSKFTIIMFSALATVISQIIMFMFNIVSKGEMVNIFGFLLVVFKECIINICLAFVLYLVFKICNKEG